MANQFTTEVPAILPGNERKELCKVAGSPSRVFRLGGQWYFSTRDGDIGPFRTREHAKREVHAHQVVIKEP